MTTRLGYSGRRWTGRGWITFVLFFGSWFGGIGVGASVASPGDTAGFKVGVLGGGVGLLLAAPVNLLVALRVERPGVDTFARSSMATASGAFVVIAGIFLGIGTSKWIGHGGWIVFLAVMAVPYLAVKKWGLPQPGKSGRGREGGG